MKKKKKELPSLMKAKFTEKQFFRWEVFRWENKIYLNLIYEDLKKDTLI